MAEMEKEKLNPLKKHMKDIWNLLEDSSARLSQTEEDYVEQVKSTQPVLPRVPNASFREICAFYLEWKKGNKLCLP